MKYWYALLIALLLAGCVAPPPARKTSIGVTVPDKWQAGADKTGPVLASWWESFGDTGIVAVVEEALEKNYDLQLAAARLEAAIADARIAGASLAPSLDAGFDGQRVQRNFIGFPIPGAGQRVLTSRSTSFGVSLNTSWELDLWGRIRSGKKAALADLQASEADLAAARQSVAAQAVKAWLAVVATGQQVELARQTVANYKTTAERIHDRYQRGLRSSLDLRLARTSLATAEATLADLCVQHDRVKRQFEVLLGRYPAGNQVGTHQLPPLASQAEAGLPAELLTRRPDLAAAERRLAAADMRLLQAKAALFPRLSLGASTGTSAAELADLVSSDFKVWTLAGNLTQPIFEGGRLRAGVSLAKARSRQALIEYCKAVLKAFNEVESTLAAEGLLAGREQHLGLAAEQAHAALRLAEDRYDRGLENFLTVLETQRRTFESDSQLINIRRQRLETRVDLHLALGGGFGISQSKPTTANSESINHTIPKS